MFLTIFTFPWAIAPITTTTGSSFGTMSVIFTIVSELNEVPIWWAKNNRWLTLRAGFGQGQMLNFTYVKADGNEPKENGNAF